MTGLKHALREEELRLLAKLRQRARHPPKELVQSGDSAGAKVSDVLCRPSAPKRPPASPPIAQLSLLAEEANLARVNHEENMWRFYRMEIWPDLLDGALLMRQWGRIGTEGSISILTLVRL